MATSNLDALLTPPKGVLPLGSTAETQLGFSVLNLCQMHLTKDQISALEKGLIFCATPVSPDITNLWNDLEEFFRQIRIKRLFYIVHSNESSNSPFEVKSTWTPPKGQDPIIDTFIKTVKLDSIVMRFNKRNIFK